MGEQELLSNINRSYLECFCRRSRDGFFIRYWDPALPDMYCYNFLYLKKTMNSRLLLKTLTEKMENCAAAGQSYFRLELEEDPALRPSAYPAGGEIEHNGIYTLRPSRADVERWPFSPEISIRPMSAQSDAKALLEIHSSMPLAFEMDFCRRRAERTTRVYLSGGCRDFLAYCGETPAGSCELFEHGSAAKLEDLCVRSELRRRKVASTLLRTLALTALDDGCEMLTLTADENDTPRKFYQALGFRKAADIWAITWKF